MHEKVKWETQGYRKGKLREQGAWASSANEKADQQSKQKVRSMKGSGQSNRQENGNRAST